LWVFNSQKFYGSVFKPHKLIYDQTPSCFFDRLKCFNLYLNIFNTFGSKGVAKTAGAAKKQIESNQLFSAPERRKRPLVSVS
jgi:hypothetical protein